MTRISKTALFFISCVLLLNVAIGCGKKGPPIAPEDIRQEDYDRQDDERQDDGKGNDEVQQIETPAGER